ncbi:hypothetical protein Poli38472_011622 [Pythium oligandrum]|uniref:WASH complex subunit 4 N-terminal domain-containing protein n=1 Tax=Pythium oligandrum TaxID=41045 RepID=A0A8K1FMD3_PYTOL|nr:hypothetical protein Poli38472_011622 [Pythium oligandrum]|eukprot:TMW64742.1 hypothetical protein Poli38472_011622 [Pythium oligandrum]
MKVTRELQLRVEKGMELFMKIYCARSCACAVPPAPVDADVNSTIRYYSAVFDGKCADTICYPPSYYSERDAVLQPQVDKLRQLADYCAQTVSALCDTIQRIAAQESNHHVIPDVLLQSIIDLMDVVLRMNHLHDTKSGLRNDFSLYKRAFKYVKGEISNPDQANKEIQRLQEFVGSSQQTKEAVWDSLRHNLTSVKRFDQVVALLVRHCTTHLESDRWLLPQDRFKLIRVLPCLLAVLDSTRGHKNKSNGLQNVDRKPSDMVLKTITRFPVVPIFADIIVKPTAMYTAKSIIKADIAMVDGRARDPLYDVVATATRAKIACNDYLSRFTFVINKLCKPRLPAQDDQMGVHVFELVREGLRYVTEWKTSYSLFIALKYQVPKSNEQLAAMGANMDSTFVEYERAVRHNCDATELIALAEVVHGIKSIVESIQRHWRSVVPLLRAYIYNQVQEFIQNTLIPIVHRAEKRKNASTKILQDLRLTCGDWQNPHFPADDYKKRRRERQWPTLRSRTVSPTLSQIQMVRTIVNAICLRSTSGEAKTGLFSFQRELKSGDVDTLHQFYVESADFSAILDSESVLQDLSSCSELWFREVFLEIMKSPQVSIEASIPWLMLKRVFRDNSRPTFPLVLSLLDVYNDAALDALDRVQNRCIYDEIDAEARMFLDQMAYFLADEAYLVAKSDATRMVVGYDCIERLQDTAIAQYARRKPKQRTTRVTRMKRIVDVTDEMCDLCLIVGGHVNARFMRDLAVAMAKIEVADVTAVVATDNLLTILRDAHTALGQFLELEPFDLLWDEVTGRAHTPSPYELTRIQRAISSCVLRDLVQNFGYNEYTCRYFRTPLPAVLRQSLPASPRTVNLDGTRDVSLVAAKKALEGIGLERECRVGFEVMHRPFRSFLGAPHIQALVSLVTPVELVCIVNDAVDFVTHQIEDIMELCIPVLGSAIPPYRFPKALYRADGCYGYFESKFKHMMDSEELEAQIFHCFRGIGNALLFVMGVDSAVKALGTDSTDLPRAGTTDLLRHTLQRLHRFLEYTEMALKWEATRAANPEKPENTASFFLVWNALEFLSCCPRQGVTNRELYGDGVQFAGCTILHLLGQRTLYDTWNPSQHVLDVQRYDITKRTTDEAIYQAYKGRKHSHTTPVNSTRGANYAVGALDPEMVENTKHFCLQAFQMRQASRSMFHRLLTTWSPPLAIQSEDDAPLEPPGFKPPPRRQEQGK